MNPALIFLLVMIFGTMMLFVLWSILIDQPLREFMSRLLLSGRIPNTRWNRFIVKKFKLRQVRKHNGGFTLEAKIPFKGWCHVRTYSNSEWGIQDRTEDIALIWNHINELKTLMASKPVIEVLTNPADAIDKPDEAPVQ